MIDIVFYFQVHQPFRLLKLKPADRVRDLACFDDSLNKFVVERVAEKCYLPMNRLLLDVIEQSDGDFRCSFSLSGTLIDQLRRWVPAALDSFVALSETGCVEFLCETRQHSLAALTDPEEFRQQVELQRATVEDLFGSRPTTFRNTELILSNDICRQVEQLGFSTILGEGADRVLGWRSPQVPFTPRGCDRLKVLLRSYRLSDDIAFRFSNPDWPQHPLFADTFAGWLHDTPPPAQFIGLFMDYETFGEHQGAHTGIFDFMRQLPGHVLERDGFRFRTPAQVAALRQSAGELDVPEPMSWADEERNVSAWLGNPMQRVAHRALYDLRPRVAALADRHGHLLEAWRQMSTSDHVYYMATKSHSDAEVHEYFSPYDSPHAAFVTFMTALEALRADVGRAEQRERVTPPVPPTATASGAESARGKERSGPRSRAAAEGESGASRRRRGGRRQKD